MAKRARSIWAVEPNGSFPQSHRCRATVATGWCYLLLSPKAQCQINKFRVHEQLKSFEHDFDCFAWARGRKSSSDAKIPTFSTHSITIITHMMARSLSRVISKVLRTHRLPSGLGKYSDQQSHRYSRRERDSEKHTEREKHKQWSRNIMPKPSVKREMRFLRSLWIIYRLWSALKTDQCSYFIVHLLLLLSFFSFVRFCFHFYCRHATVFTFVFLSFRSIFFVQTSTIHK